MDNNIKKISLVSFFFILFYGCSIPSRKSSLHPAGVTLKINQKKLNIKTVLSNNVDSDFKVQEIHGRDVASTEVLIDGIAMPDDSNQENRKVYFLDGAEELNLQHNYFDIPVVYNKQVKKWIDYYTTKGRKYFELHTERAGRYAPIIGAILEENGLPRDLIFLAMAESGFSNSAKSISAAVGTWQFMPATGRLYSLNQDWYVDERKDPIKSTIAAAQYLSKLYSMFGDWEIATAAYNAGEGRLGRAIKKYKSNDFWRISQKKYLKNETKNYVPKIMALAIIGKNLKTFGFVDIDFYEPFTFDEIKVRPLTDILKLSKALKIEVVELKRLNPELLRGYTPPNIDNYVLRLPLQGANAYNSCCAKLDLSVTDFKKYIIKSVSVNLKTVSKKFNIHNSYVLSHLNSVSPNHRFKKGNTVILPFRAGEKIVFYQPQIKKNRKNKRYHIVRRGESLYMIARKHKTSVRKLIIANTNVSYSKKIYPGFKLVIQ